MKTITVSAPGRICLFGEHQDYLNLPVIPMAINLRVEITGTPREDKKFVIHLPDIHEEEIVEMTDNGELPYTKKRDYFRSIINVLRRNGYNWKNGWECEVRGKIPIRSGTSSSSALNNVWCKFLIETSDTGNKQVSDSEVARYSYLAEVVEFNEAGGQMDQYSTALGDILFLEFAESLQITILSADLGYFVLGDSLQPKNTQKVLAETKAPALSGMKKLQQKIPDLNFKEIELVHLSHQKDVLNEKETKVLEGVIQNRKITMKAKEELQKKTIDRKRIGELLTKHHYFLDKNLNISTPKINTMIESAIKAGAYGGKINGSGGGGCMFAYAPQNPEAVANALEEAGGKAYIVTSSNGLEVY